MSDKAICSGFTMFLNWIHCYLWNCTTEKSADAKKGWKRVNLAILLSIFSSTTCAGSQEYGNTNKVTRAWELLEHGTRKHRLPNGNQRKFQYTRWAVRLHYVPNFLMLERVTAFGLTLIARTGFPQAWKVLEFRGLSWKVLDILICLEKYWKIAQKPWKVLEFNYFL